MTAGCARVALKSGAFIEETEERHCERRYLSLVNFICERLVNFMCSATAPTDLREGGRVFAADSHQCGLFCPWSFLPSCEHRSDEGGQSSRIV